MSIFHKRNQKLVVIIQLEKVTKKLNTELTYARNKLERSMRSRENIEQVRERVDWLEAEIEKNILSNKNVSV